MNLFSPRGALLALAAFACAAIPAAAQVTLYGTLSNFDVINDTGGEVHGFEIEFQGVSSVNSYYNWNRYGPPTVTPIPTGNGVYVRWMSPYDPATGKFIVGTPLNTNPTPASGHNCVIGTPFYTVSGCEHFGLATVGNATKIIYRWMVADPNNPGQLITSNSQVAIPAPVWSVQPPALPGQPAVVVADIDPPVPPPPAKLFGTPQWMKTYKTEINRQVNLDELVPDNPVVPEDQAQLETSWDLMQTELGSNSKRKRKRGGLGAGKKAVVRRLEIYKYAGAVDPVTGQALCIDPTCTVPDPSEIGDFIGAQNAAANLNAPDAYPVTVTVTGDGAVEDSTRAIRCPGTTCAMTVNAGTSVTLTATNKKGIFSGWSGACQGASASCTFNVNSAAPVTALFRSTYKLVLKANGSGTVSSNPSGSSFLEGTSVTVIAVPGAGATWKGWTGGGCSGLGLSCTTTINADTTLTANFR